MPIPNLPPVPNSLKSIQHYLQIANEHEVRDPVVSYWCRFYALQLGIKIDKSSPEAKKLLFFLMDWLEGEKSKNKDNEAIANDIPAQAHLENHALKLFLWADEQDRAGVFNKNVVKAFYTAGMVYSVLETFGDLTEEVAKNQKYAKWKAAYIHNCLKNGEMPVPGPMGGDQEEDSDFSMPGPSNVPAAPSGSINIPGSGPAVQPPTDFTNDFPATPSSGRNPPASPMAPSSFPAVPATTYNIPPEADTDSIPAATAAVSLDPSLMTKAQKYCKYASSALNYDDIPTAVTNLQKALQLLTTGQDE